MTLTPEGQLLHRVRDAADTLMRELAAAAEHSPATRAWARDFAEDFERRVLNAWLAGQAVESYLDGEPR